MSKAAKASIAGENPSRRPPERDVLHFLTRTLKAHCLDAEPQDMLEKLENLKAALDQQENTLADWPDSPSKDRICEALARARALVAQIVEDSVDKASAARGTKAT
jgi:antitoxin component HigA of HigAB toxin-antitoxin module